MCKKCIIVYWSFWWGRGLIGRQWCIHMKRGGGGDWDRPGGQEVFCVSVTATPAPPRPCSPVWLSFFGQFALKLWNVFALSGISLEWELALGPAFRRPLPLPGWKALFRRDEEWLMRRSTLCLFPPALPPAFRFPIKCFPHSYLCLLTECDLWHLFGCE